MIGLHVNMLIGIDNKKTLSFKFLQNFIKCGR